jgi:hypothetical protein
VHRIIILAAALGLTGCGGSNPPPMAGTPESSRSALVVALDGWKGGGTYQSLSDRSPPLHFVDDDLNRGTKLLDYRIEGEGRPLGTGYSYVVTLTLRDKDAGKTRTKKVAYTAVTEPKHAVTREDRQP